MAEKNELSAYLKVFADRHQTFVRSKNSTTWRNTSQWHYLTDEELISSLSKDSSVRRAFGPMESTYFIVIQIEGTKSATASQTARGLFKQLKDISAKPKSFYVEELDLWQIYLFFDAPVKTKQAKSVVRNWLQNNLFDIGPEEISILPGDEPLQIPLQASFTWLNEELNPIAAASEMSFQNAVTMFLQDLRTNANCFEDLEAVLTATESFVPTPTETFVPASQESSVTTSIETTVPTESSFDFAQSKEIYFSPDSEHAIVLIDQDLYTKKQVTTDPSPASETELEVERCYPESEKITSESESLPSNVSQEADFIDDSDTVRTNFASKSLEQISDAVPLGSEGVDQQIEEKEQAELTVPTEDNIYDQEEFLVEQEFRLSGYADLEGPIGERNSCPDNGNKQAADAGLHPNVQADTEVCSDSQNLPYVDDRTHLLPARLPAPAERPPDDKSHVPTSTAQDLEHLSEQSTDQNLDQNISFEVQRFLFVLGDDANKRAPPAKCAASQKSEACSSSSRDGPKQRKKSTKPKPKADSEWESFEQLTLPLGTNTS